MGFELRPYQVDCVNQTLEKWNSFQKVLGVAPTGAGKTRIFSSLTKERLKHGRTLVIAHREELIDQAIHKLYRDERIAADKEKAEHRARISADVVVGSIQSLVGMRKERFSKDHFSTIIVDEAHHALADSYQGVLEYFNAKVLGVTATPDRGDKKNLGQYFEDIAFEIGLLELIDQGYLSKITCKTIPLNIDLSKVRKTAGDFNAADLGESIEPILERAAEEIIANASGRKILLFFPLIATARKFSEIARLKGANCDFVSGECVDRAEKLQAFRDRKIDWLANSMLLTEGYDDPSIDCVVVLRPTQSRALYSQMIGRGTRVCEGKENLLILDFLWHVEKHNLVKAAHLIAGNEEEAKAMTDIIEGGGGFGDEELDLQDVKASAQEQREASLRRQIEAQSKKKSRSVDPIEFGLNLHEQSIMEFEPTMPWHSDPISPKQRETLEKSGIDVSSIKGKGHASAIMDVLFSRRRLNLASPKQLVWLIKNGHPNPHKCGFQEAKEFLDHCFGKKAA